MENKYSRGKIYKVVDAGCSKCYFGSTTEKLFNRLSKHKNIYKQYLAGKRAKNDKTSTCILFEEFGMENCKIELVENYPCNSKEELNAGEGFYIKNNECVNKLVAGRTQKERYEEIHKHKKFICDVCNCETYWYGKSKHLQTAKHLQNKKSKEPGTNP